MGIDVPGVDHPEQDGPALTLDAVLTDPEGNEAARASVPVVSVGDTTVELSVAEPRLWWPAGLGGQPLYGLSVEVQYDGELVAAAERRLGLRTVTVDESPDEAGTGWAIVVNGRRVRIRGYNWIPDDPFIAEVTGDRLGQRLDQAVDGGANLLRVWGGGYFSTEAFMDGCDERGLMVWHDFLFACSAYDESEEMITSVTLEAEQAVARLAAHPSLVLWCGGNECVWGDYDWGWREILQGRPWERSSTPKSFPPSLTGWTPAVPICRTVRGPAPWTSIPTIRRADPSTFGRSGITWTTPTTAMPTPRLSLRWVGARLLRGARCGRQ